MRSTVVAIDQSPVQNHVHSLANSWFVTSCQTDPQPCMLRIIQLLPETLFASKRQLFLLNAYKALNSVLVPLSHSKCGDHMMTSPNGNISHVTGALCGKFTGHRWIPHTKASDVELWCFLWSAPWINGRVNNRKAGDLRRQRAHYDIIVMILKNFFRLELNEESC